MTAPVIVSPADPAKIAAVLQAKRAREAAKALRVVQRRLMHGRGLSATHRVIACRAPAEAPPAPDGLVPVTQEVTIVDVEDLICEVAARCGLTRAQVVAGSRVPEIVDARHEIWWRLHHEYGLSYSRIGRVFNRDHTTIRHGVDRWRTRIRRAGPRSAIRIDAFLDAVLSESNCTREALASGARGAQARRARRVAIEALTDRIGLSAAEVGKVLGMTRDAVLQRLSCWRRADGESAG